MCENCKPENQEPRPVEERLRNLEQHQYVLLQSVSKLIDDYQALEKDHEEMKRAFCSFCMKVMGEVPAIREGMVAYIENRADNVGMADQMTKLLSDLIDHSKPMKRGE